MKIVYCVTHCTIPYGGLRVLLEQANRLSERGHEVEMWVLNKNIISDIFPSKIRILHIPNEYDFDAQKILAMHPEKVGAMSPEVVIVGSYAAMPPTGQFPQARMYWYLQHDEVYACFSPATTQTFQECLNRPLTILTNSAWTRDMLKQKYRKESKLVQVGISRELFSPSSTPLYNLKNPSVLFTYSDYEWKGAADLFIALERAAQKVDNINVLAFSAMVPKKFLAGRNMILHLQPRQEDLRRIFSSATIMVSPSWSEGFGLPGLEAMACGVPLVTTDSGGVRDYAIPDVNCLMVPPQEPELLGGAIVRLLQDEELRKRFIQAGLKTADEFDWQKRIGEVELALQS